MEKLLFISDEPKKDLSVDDSFGHKYYANSIFSIITDRKEENPFTIGVFGRWGIGKTSIINELNRQINFHNSSNQMKYRVLLLDAWEYSEINFRREFLLDIANHCSKLDEYKNKLSNKKSTEGFEIPRINRQLLITTLQQLGLFILLSFLLLVFFYIIVPCIFNQQITSEQHPLFALFSGFISSLLVFPDNLKKIFQARKIVEEIIPPIFPDEFKKEFDQLINEELKTYARIIIILDNLDRVKEDIVIQILSSIRTFLDKDKCLFILPCDNEGLIKHIVSSKEEISDEKQAEEYLRKYFNTTISIKEILIDDLETYVNSIIDQMIIFDDTFTPGNFPNEQWKSYQKSNKEQVSYVFRVALINNPRQIIQFANKLTSNYILAIERSKDNIHLLNNIITNLGFLAKITVIEDLYPHFYDLLTEDADVLRQLQIFLVTEDEQLIPNSIKNDNKKSVSTEWNCGLRDFLRKTSDIHNDDVADFLFFRQSPSRKNISNFPRFIDYLLTRNDIEIKKLLLLPDANKGAIFEQIYQKLRWNITNDNFQNCLSIIYVICKLHNEIPTEEFRIQVANLVASTMSLKKYDHSAIDIGLNDLLGLLEYSRKISQNKQIMDYIIYEINFDDNQPKSKNILINISEHINLLFNENKQNLKQTIDKYCQNSNYLLVLREFFDTCYDKDESFIPLVVPQSFYEQYVNEIQKSNYSVKDLLSFIHRYQTHFDKNVFEKCFKLIIGQLNFVSTDLSTNNLKAIQIIGVLDFRLANDQDTSSLFTALITLANQPLSNKSKIQISNTIIEIIPRIPQHFQKNLMNYVVRTIPLYEIKDLDGLCFIFNSLPDDCQINEFESMANLISQKYSASPSPSGIMEFSKILNKYRYFDKLQEFIVSLWPTYEFKYEDLSTIINYFDPDTQPDVVRRLLISSEKLPNEKVKIRLQMLGKFHNGYSQEKKEGIIEEIKNNWILCEDPTKIENSNEFLKEFIPIMNRKLKNELFSKIIQVISESIYDESNISEKKKKQCAIITMNWDNLSKKSKSDFLELVLEFLEEGRPIITRNFGFELLRSIKTDQVVQEKMFSTFISDIRIITTETDVSGLSQTIIDFFPYYSDIKKQILISELRKQESNKNISTLIAQLESS